MDSKEKQRIQKLNKAGSGLRMGRKEGIFLYVFAPVGYLLFGSVLPGLLSGFLVRFFPGMPGGASSWYAVFSFGMGFLFVALLYEGFGEQVEMGKNITAAGILEAAAFGVALFLLINFVVSPALGSVFQTSEANYSESVSVLFQEPIPAFFQLVVIAPLLEELIFRGLLLKRSLRFRKAFPSVLLVSAIFGALHLSIVQGLSAMAAGIFLCLLYVRRRSVFLCILTHGIFNGIAFWLMMAVG